jgi:hypothetical protein
MTEGVKFEQGEYGLRAVLTGAWSPAIENVLFEQSVAELELNHAKGWIGNDLSFLRCLGGIKFFRILDFNIPSVEPIHFLHELRSLEITT